jgi:hypothetical protein
MLAANKKDIYEYYLQTSSKRGQMVRGKKFAGAKWIGQKLAEYWAVNRNLFSKLQS